MDEDDKKDDSKRYIFIRPKNKISMFIPNKRIYKINIVPRLSYSLRKSRNLSEKKRRDQFNGLVNELSAMVSSANRKMDKSTVLKSTISFLKNYNGITNR